MATRIQTIKAAIRELLDTAESVVSAELTYPSVTFCISDTFSEASSTTLTALSSKLSAASSKGEVTVVSSILPASSSNGAAVASDIFVSGTLIAAVSSAVTPTEKSAHATHASKSTVKTFLDIIFINSFCLSLILRARGALRNCYSPKL